LTIGDEKNRKVLDDNDKPIKDYEIKNGNELFVKNLGP